jgi:hypothetical protein
VFFTIVLKSNHSKIEHYSFPVISVDLRTYNDRVNWNYWNLLNNAEKFKTILKQIEQSCILLTKL